MTIEELAELYLGRLVAAKPGGIGRTGLYRYPRPAVGKDDMDRALEHLVEKGLAYSKDVRAGRGRSAEIWYAR